MKRSRQLALLAIAQAPWLLAGCSDEPQDLTQRGFYTSIEACERDGNGAGVCRRASDAAAAANAQGAPRFKSKAECIAEYGDLCAEREHESGVWGPLMTGFLISQILSPGRAPVYLDASPIYRTRAGQFTELYRRDGGYGSYGGGWSAPGGATTRPIDIAPNRAVTVSRAGFGSRAAARSGWGGSLRGG